MLILEIITPIYEYDEKKIKSLESLLANRSPDPFRPKTDNIIELAKAIEKMAGATVNRLNQRPMLSNCNTAESKVYVLGKLILNT